ncbi:hypothetical protein ACFLQV_02615 [Calditrichota bacterium]
MSDYREDIIDRLADTFTAHPQVRQGKMFGHPGFGINGRFFCMAYADGLTLKLSPSDYKQAMELPESEAFSPRGTPMGTWVTLSFPDAEDYIANWSWIEKAMDYIITDEAAPPKKSKKKSTGSKN